MNQNLSPHVAWLVCLGEIMNTVRRKGLLAIEHEISMPESEGAPFLRHPALLKQPYLDFARDLLRLRLGGFDDIADLDLYAKESIATLTQRNWLGIRQADASLLKTIWLTLHSFYQGWSPTVACDFGRQAIPAHLRPDFDTIERLLTEARRAVVCGEPADPNTPRNLDTEAEQFINSLGKP